MKIRLLKLTYKGIFCKEIFLVFILLFVVSGSYTFPGSIDQKVKPVDHSIRLLSVDINQKYFALFPSELIQLRQKKKNECLVDLNPSFTIYRNGVFPLKKMAAYLKQNNPKLDDKHSCYIAELYIDEAIKEGINHDVAFSQMCLETGFLKFGGDVNPDQNNFCGLGVTGGGVKGLTFDDARSGIRAHIQHLKAYASTDELNMELIDERFHYVKRGSAVNVDDLTGKWATDKNYGDKISNIISRIDNFQN